MPSVISQLLAEVRLGEPVTDEGLTLIPIFGEIAGAPSFITLTEAIAAGSLVVTEVSTGGSVPELQAKNLGEIGVVILDGEELAGAKQNRVLNTSVYLAPGKEITIPVSCTEHGRWSYATDRFYDSGHVSAHRVRSAGHASVTASARTGAGYRSDQGRVWSEVAMLQDRHKIRSSTSAMRDVYDQSRARLKARESKFAAQTGQIGVFALWGGSVIGFDVVARPEAYARLHDRLVGSYALDTLAESAEAGAYDLRTAKEFLVSLPDAVSTTHESPGGGVSHRFTGPGFVGSALTVDDAILHAVFFGVEDVRSEHGTRYPSARQRRSGLGW